MVLAALRSSTRPTSRWLPCVAAVGGVLAALAASDARADDPTYADVPRVTAIAPEAFRNLFGAAGTSVVRVAILGDSQETEPAAWGDYYIANLNTRLAEVFGPATESQFFTNTWAVTTPRWLGCVRTATESVATTVPPSALLPGMHAQSLVDDASLALPDSRFLLLHDAARTRDSTLDGGVWMEPNGPYLAEILTVARKGQGGLRWRNEPTDDDAPFAASVVQEGVLSLPRKAPSGAFVWTKTPPLDFAGRDHVQLALRGSSPTAPVELVGVRFRSVAAPRGVVVQSFAKGGMRALDYLNDHQQSGGMLRAWGPSVVVLHYGTNDAKQLASVADWKSRLLAMISLVRAQAKNPALPIILAAELRCGSTPAAQAMIDRMPAVAHEIALSDPHVLALNLTRITAEEYGWDTEDFYLADPLHYQPYAQRFLARAFVGELLQHLAIPDPGCGSANWADCVRSWGASCLPGGCRILMSGDAQSLGLPWSGPGSDCDDDDGDGAPDECGVAGPADINRDGFVDAADLAFILLAWGGPDPMADITNDGVVDGEDLANLLLAWGQ
jgi:lysophospholipase L1-like esterase